MPLVPMLCVGTLPGGSASLVACCRQTMANSIRDGLVCPPGPTRHLTDFDVTEAMRVDHDCFTVGLSKYQFFLLARISPKVIL